MPFCGFFFDAREALISFLIPFLELARCATRAKHKRKKLQFFNEREEKRVWIFFASPSSSSLFALAANRFPFFLFRLFARCIFHHSNPFYVVSEVLMLSAAQEILNDFKMHVLVCVVWRTKKPKKNTKQNTEKKVIRHFFHYAHSHVLGTDFSSPFSASEMHFWTSAEAQDILFAKPSNMLFFFIMHHDESLLCSHN
jgi:hypothetical protein